MNRLLFELLARWVSGLIPGVALLHIMCKTKKPADERPAAGQTRCAPLQHMVEVGLGLGTMATITTVYNGARRSAKCVWHVMPGAGGREGGRVYGRRTFLGGPIVDTKGWYLERCCWGWNLLCRCEM